MRLAIVARRSKFRAGASTRTATRRDLMRNAVRTTVAAIITTTLATPVYAQFSPNLAGMGSKPKTDVEARQEKERDAGYKSGLSRIPDAKAKVDPWGSVRNAPAAANQSQSRSNSK